MNPISSIVAILTFILVMAAGWITNVIWTFHTTSTTDLILGILGAVMFPIGAFHGIWLWF